MRSISIFNNRPMSLLFSLNLLSFLISCFCLSPCLRVSSSGHFFLAAYTARVPGHEWRTGSRIVCPGDPFLSFRSEVSPTDFFVYLVFLSAVHESKILANLRQIISGVIIDDLMYYINFINKRCILCICVNISLKTTPFYIYI